MAKTRKPTIMKAHRIARAIMRKKGSRGKNPWAIGMAVAKKTARKRRRRRS